MPRYCIDRTPFEITRVYVDYAVYNGNEPLPCIERYLPVGYHSIPNHIEVSVGVWWLCLEPLLEC